MKTKRFYKILSSVLILSSFLVTSCRFMTPVKEMSLAKTGITEAVKVKAEKYAPEELKNAKDSLIKSHDFVMKEDADKAKTEAVKSREYSDAAIAKSWPLLAKDTLDEAKKIYAEADSAFAEKYAAEDFQIAGEHIAGAEGLLNESKFPESYLRSKEAIVFGTDARDKALANTAALKENLERIKAEARKLEELGGRDFAPEEMGIIDTRAAEADSLIGQNNLKDAVPKVKEADDALKIAALKTLKGSAAERLKAAETKLEEVKKSPKKDLFMQDIIKAEGSIVIGKELFAKDSYEEAGLKAQEALDILNSISIAEEKQSEEIRIEEGKQAVTEESVYVVKLNPEKRDCLWRIAVYTYNDARLWPLIYMANRDKIKDPDLIFPGQKLTIPPVNGNGNGKKENGEKAIDKETPADTGAGKEVPDAVKDEGGASSGKENVPPAVNSAGEEKEPVPAEGEKSVDTAKPGSEEPASEAPESEENFFGSHPDKDIDDSGSSDDITKDAIDEEGDMNEEMDINAD